MGLDLAAGGHLTHGAPPNVSGKWFKVVSYTVRRDTQTIDMDEVEAKALEAKPKVIIAGGSAYARFWDFARFRAIADKVGELTVFQRRPNWSAPLNNSLISEQEMADIRKRYDEIFAACARSPGGFVHEPDRRGFYEVSREEHIPKSFAAKIFQSLAKAGLVKSIRGSGGGFSQTSRLP